MRYLCMVSRDERPLYEYLKNHFASRPNVEVLVDRRHGQRHQHSASPAIERRQVDRRRQPAIDEDLAALGIAVARLP